MYFPQDLSSGGMSQLVRHGAWTLPLLLLAVFVTKMYEARSQFWRLRKKGFAMPPWHPLWGHLHLARDILGKLPPGAHAHYLGEQIRKRYPDVGEVYYLDLWPFSTPFLVITSPNMMHRLMAQSPPKDEGFIYFMRPITGGQDLLCMEGQKWKTWRSTLSPGFSSSHIMSLVPDMITDILLFRDILQENATKGRTFALQKHVTDLTLDVIGRVTLDTGLNNLRGHNDMVAALRSQITWSSYGNDATLTLPNPFRPFVQWYNSFIMDRFLKRELENRYNGKLNSKNNKSIIDLALKGYKASATTKSSRTMDATFEAIARAQIKLFLFAGHDTTSGTICYAYHLLSSNPHTLALLRAEHSRVLGPVSSTPSRIADSPHLLNALPYTLAVVRETLRLFPPASIVRAGSPSFVITNPDTGIAYPTVGMYIWAVHHAMQRDPRHWGPRAAEFLPERWLAAEGDELYAWNNIEAWRPFEYGPRACIGQELAVIEIKLCLALTAREFDVHTVYEECDRGKGGPWSVEGERGFQVAIGAAHPRDGMPVRVTFAKES